jgi:sugar lactone lactonase YvrE
MNSYTSVPSLGAARVATGQSHFLAEGPIWDPIRGKVLWVDIIDGAVHSGRFAYGGAILSEERIDFPDTAGAVAVSAAGELVVAGTHRLYYRGTDGVITAGPEIIVGEARRLNDGKPDPQGRMLVGTKGPGGEVLLRVDADGSLTTIDDDLTLANGLAWTADGRRLFTVDTMTQRIFVRDYDPVTASTGQRTVFTTLDHGYPDGMTIDDEDHLWVAVWGEGCVLRIAPSGDVVGRVDVPAPHASCPIFAGPDLDTLVITTATEGLDTEQLERHPLSGRLFTVRTGHRGNPPYLWTGLARPASTMEGTA